MTGLSAIIAAVQDVVSGVSGITLAPDIPVEQIPSGGVYALIYPGVGTWQEITAGREQGEHTLHMMVATPRVNLRTDWARVIAAGDAVAAALLNAGTLTGNILQTNEVRYSFGEMEWGGQTLIGWRLEIDLLLTGSL